MVCFLSGKLEEFSLERIGEYYSRYRLVEEGSVRTMARSLHELGQISPVVVCQREAALELIDGFKRLRAARESRRIQSLWGRIVEVDDRGAKVAMYALNRGSNGISELEQARIVCALVREDGLSQLEVAALLGRHHSWVSRRLALIEQLSDKTKEALEVGLLTPTACRHIARLPRGKQDDVSRVSRQESLTSRELAGVVELLRRTTNATQWEAVLENPRAAMTRARAVVIPSYDPRLSAQGNKISKRLGLLVDLLTQLHSWFEHGGREHLTLEDRAVLAPSFEKIGSVAGEVALFCNVEVGE